MAIEGIDYSGTGTTQDPYLVYTIAGFLYCIDQVNSTILVANDLDAKHDATYREGISPITLKCSVLCGRAFPYDSSKQYQIGDKCTFNDPDYGNIVYTCKVPCQGVSPTNTNYFTNIGSAYARLTGFKVTGANFIIATLGPSTCTVTNIFIESGIHYKTSAAAPTFAVGRTQSSASTNTNVYYNDCRFSMCIMFNGYDCSVDFSTQIHKNRCSEYYKFVGYSLGSSSPSNNIFACSRYSCTVEFSNCYFQSAYLTDGNNLVRNASYCSFVGDIVVRETQSSSDRNYVYYQYCSNCFFSVTVTSVYNYTYSLNHRFNQCSGVSIYNSSTDHKGSVTYNNYVLAATESQCKDKDWLIAKGFIVG